MSDAAGTTTHMADVAATPQEDGLLTDDTSKTVAPFKYNEMDEVLLWPGSGRALFSTAMGTRPQSSISKPAPPVIVRSDKRQGVIASAGYWRKQQPRLSFSIFANSGWSVEDLWDAADIHLETREHLEAVLQYLMLDNGYSAGLHSQDWARTHPDLFAEFIGMRHEPVVADPTDPLRLVDKFFKPGSIPKPGPVQTWSRMFCWHTLQAMRDCPVITNAEDGSVAVLLQGTSSQEVHYELPVAAKAPTANTTSSEPATATASTAHSRQPTDKLPQVSPKITIPAPFVPSTAAPQEVHGLTATSHGSASSVPPYHYQSVGHVMGGMPTHGMGSPSMGGSILRNPKNRQPRHDAYNPSLSGAYGENIPRMTSGGHSSRLPPLHSPHFNPTAMAFGQAVLPPQHIQSFPQGYPPMSPSAYPVQAYQSGYGPTMMMPPQQMRPAGIPPPPDFGRRHPSSTRGGRGIMMGDATNNPYYASNTVPHHQDSRRSDRRGSFYGSTGSNSLYDPYSGTRPAFHDYNASRRSGRGGYMDQPGRSRKHSGPDARARNGSYGVGPDTTGLGGHRSYDNRMPRVPMSDDPAIVGDLQYGCHQTWIGPQNHNVNELFVANLPEGTSDAEIQDMFVREVNIVPIQATVKPSVVGRPHAFVLFASTADTKLALEITRANPQIRGSNVAISVPRRFYQKEDNSHNRLKGPSCTDENASANALAQDTELQYSPQDVRSHLQKKSSRQSPDTDVVCSGSPKSRKPAKGEQSIVEEPVLEYSATSDAPKFEAAGTALENSHAKRSETPSSHNDGAITEEIVAAAIEIPALEDGANVVPGEPSNIPPMHCAQEHTMATGHVRVESQTKATYEDTETSADIEDDAAVIVNVPRATQDDQSTVQQESTVPDSETAPDIATTLTPEPSADEVGHESSFLSAQETVTNSDPTMVHELDPLSTTHGIEATKTTQPAAPSDFTKDSRSLASPIESSSLHQTSATAEPATTVPVSTTTKSDLAAADTSASAEAMTTTTVTASSIPPTLAPKKQGPQQTQSLNPFAKPSKSQRKKDKKEQKKREQKKGQEEKVTKAKTDMIASSTGGDPSESTTTSGMAAHPSKDSVDVTAQHEDVVAISTSTGDARDNDMAKAETSKRDNSLSADLGSESDTSGKKPPNDAPNTGIQAGSVTLKTKVALPVTQDLLAAGSSNSFTPAPPVQYSNRDNVRMLERTAISPVDLSATTPIVKGDIPPTTIPKARKAEPAVLSLNFGAYTSSARDKVNQPELTETSDVKSASVNSDTALQPSMSKPNVEFETMSNASSATLHPSESAQPSPSQDFFTPLQTPVNPGAILEQAEPAKKKKKKKNKKKKAFPAAPELGFGPYNLSQDTPTTNFNSGLADGGNLFTSNQTFIDSYREAQKDENSYIAMVNREIAQRDAKKEAVEAAGQSQQGGLVGTFGDTRSAQMTDGAAADLKSSEEEASHLRKIQAFLVENPKVVRMMQEKQAPK
ncbi:hypothetical protein ACEQ8H_003850 [Pleosporales sp. CAS-2024a]